MTPLGNKLVGEITLRGITLWEEILRWGLMVTPLGIPLISFVEGILMNFAGG